MFIALSLDISGCSIFSDNVHSYLPNDKAEGYVTVEQLVMQYNCNLATVSAAVPGKCLLKFCQCVEHNRKYDLQGNAEKELVATLK